MADHNEERGMEPEDPALAVAARHALHDEELIAAFATDGDDADDAARARRLVERCAACRDLYDDVRTIGGALRTTFGAEAVAAPERAPRSFRLTAADAARLRPGSPVLRPAVRLRDRILAALRSIGRPMGMSMAAVGVVGILFGTFALSGQAALAPVPEDVGTSGAGVPSAVPGGPKATVQPLSGETRDPGELTNPAGSPASSRLAFATEQPVTVSPGSVDMGTSATGPALLVLGASVVVLGAGIGLVVLGSRRREPDRRP